MTRDLRAHWDQQAQVYAADEGLASYAGFLALYEEECWRAIEPVLPPVAGSLILEVGCGTGRWVVHLAPRGYRMVLSDVSPEMVRQAQAKVERLGLRDRLHGFHVLDICDMHALPEDAFDVVLALGGPLSLCHDAGLAAAELRRVTRPGGYVICDAANRYRTALDLVRDGETDQLLQVLDTGRFSRPDGLTDHRFGPQELADLFERNGMRAVQVVGLCPLFPFLPSQEQARLLDDEATFAAMREVGQRYGGHPSGVALSGRLLAVAQSSA
jgi:SAM-dependent methyltransferase